MFFAPEATRWLGIWLDSAPTLKENRQKRIGKTRQAEARIRRIVNQYGVPPYPCDKGHDDVGHRISLAPLMALPLTEGMIPSAALPLETLIHAFLPMQPQPRE